jgi:hypothetical protein
LGYHLRGQPRLLSGNRLAVLFFALCGIAAAQTPVQLDFGVRGGVLANHSFQANRLASSVVFPHIASGGGCSTQIILFGQTGTGKLYMFGQDGFPKPGSALKN